MRRLHAELWEIAGNLHRADLTALQRSEQVACWMALTAEKQKDEAEFRDKLSHNSKAGRPPEEVRSAARELGINTKTARRAKKVAALSKEAKEAAKELGLDDNQSVLLAAKKQGGDDAEAQVAYLGKEAERREAENACKEADRPEDDDYSLELRGAQS